MRSTLKVARAFAAVSLVLLLLTFLLVRAASDEPAVSTPVADNRTVTDVFNQLGDFELANNQFEILSEAPLVVRISPLVFDADIEGVRVDDEKRSALYAAYRTFIHTGHESISIHVVPLMVSDLYDLKNASLIDQTRMVCVNREHALNTAIDLLDVESFDDLLGEEVGGYRIADAWSPAFRRGYYNDPGLEPGLDQFFAAAFSEDC